MQNLTVMYYKLNKKITFKALWNTFYLCNLNNLIYLKKIVYFLYIYIFLVNKFWWIIFL